MGLGLRPADADLAALAPGLRRRADHPPARQRDRPVPRRPRPGVRGGDAHRAAADRPGPADAGLRRAARHRDARAGLHDAHALPAQRAPEHRHPPVRLRGHRARCGGADAGRVLQPDARLRPARGRDPRRRRPAAGHRHPGAVGGGLPRRRLRAGLGAGAAVHEPRHRDDEGHRRRAAGDDDPDADRGTLRPGQRQAPGCQPPDLCRLRRRPQGRVGRPDPFPAGLRHGHEGCLGPGAVARGGLTNPARDPMISIEGGDSSLVRVTAFAVGTGPVERGSPTIWGGGEAPVPRMCGAQRAGL
ncbi:hypothetical protein NOCARDAX2BIS_520152 [Nocardioides sp. AX2bis]|nr:hypothetical protein NOCARDAX2BIS_520152 [Nocardioides sp. AX2bis]